MIELVGEQQMKEASKVYTKAWQESHKEILSLSHYGLMHIFMRIVGSSILKLEKSLKISQKKT